MFQQLAVTLCFWNQDQAMCGDLQESTARVDALASTAVQLRHTDSQSSTSSTPLRLLRRSGSSQGSGGSSKYGGGTGPRTLMFFKGCPRPLGCTVLLQGADAEQLTLLKKVMKVSQDRKHESCYRDNVDNLVEMHQLFPCLLSHATEARPNDASDESWLWVVT